MVDFSIEYLCPSDLLPRESNARTHSESQIKQLMRSIEHFGFTNPVLVDEHMRIIAGHRRIIAAKRLGMKRVPTVCLSDMNEADIRAYVMAENRLAEKAGWDDKLLAVELE